MNSQWLALQLAQWAQWIECCIQSSQRSGFDSWSCLIFFRLSFNRLGCSFYREDHVHFLISIRRSNMIHFITIIILIYFNSTIGYINNAQWLALQMAWFAQWIHRCILLIAKVRVWFLVKPKFVQLFFNHLGCSFYCEDFPDFHILLMLLFPRLFKLHKISFS